jgi:hypothetical protein
MSKKFLLDLAERTFFTWAEAFVGLLLVSGMTDWDTVETAMVAAIPAALAVLKGGVARYVGDKETASFGRI